MTKVKAYFKIFDNDICTLCYEFDSIEKAENWQKNYISELKQIGCYPIKGIKTKVEIV